MAAYDSLIEIVVYSISENINNFTRYTNVQSDLWVKVVKVVGNFHENVFFFFFQSNLRRKTVIENCAITNMQ